MIDSETLLCIENEVFATLSTKNDNFNANLSKKINTLIEKVSNYFFKNYEFNFHVFIKKVCEYVLKKGARYLRQDSLQVLRKFISQDNVNIISLDDYECIFF
jgi:hypothetical protein